MDMILRLALSVAVKTVWYNYEKLLLSTDELGLIPWHLWQIFTSKEYEYISIYDGLL
jgi:hypothetical protein